MSRLTSQDHRLAGFDGLRALAAITVMTYHVTLWSKFVPARALAPVLWELKGGVAIFFVISGTLLYLPYARAIRDRRGLPDWRRYARRRGVRILPGYWVALTIFALVPIGSDVIGPDMWRYYGLSEIYNSQTLFGGLGVAWSLCVEVSFYAVLPLFAVGAARLARAVGARSAVRVQLGLVALLGLASLALRGALAGSLTAPIHDHGQAVMVALPGLLDWFAIGMAVAVLAAEVEAGRGSGAVLRLARSPRWCLSLAAGAFIAGAPLQAGDIFLPWYGVFTHVALGVGSGLLVLPLIVPRAGPEAPWSLRLLGGRALGWVGTISYGIYLWHLILLEAVVRELFPSGAPGTPLALGLMWLTILGGAIVLGAASWYVVERPSQRWLRARESRGGRPVRGGRMDEISASVHSTVDPLNSSGVAADHLA